MKTLAKVLPHISIILAAMLTVFFVIDRFNSAMGFLDNDGAKILMFILCITSVANSIMLIAFQRRDARMGNRP